jgi:hypothetical protein
MNHDPIPYNVLDLRKVIGVDETGVPDWIVKEFKFIRRGERLSGQENVLHTNSLVKAIIALEGSDIAGGVICGSVGTGKTFAACSILEHLKRTKTTEKEVVRVSFAQACSGLVDDGNGDLFLEKLISARLLIIDPIEVVWYGDMRCLGLLGAILDERANSSTMQTIGIVDAAGIDRVGEHGMFIINKILSARPSKMYEIDQKSGHQFCEWVNDLRD